MILQYLAQCILKIWGWKTINRLKSNIKQIIIIAPHTSNWDMIILLFIKWAHGYKVRGLGKKELFKIPLFSFFLRKIGLYPVDRSQQHDLVRYLAKKIREEKKTVSLCITPEGTRSYVPRWHSGFYYIALEANIPITCVSMDYRTKTVEVGLSFIPSGKIEQDMKLIVHFYKNKYGKNPKQQGPIIL